MRERLSRREMETNGTDSTLQSFSSCVTVLSDDDIFRWETPGCGCRRLDRVHGDARRRSLVVQCARTQGRHVFHVVLSILTYDVTLLTRAI